MKKQAILCDNKMAMNLGGLYL